MVKLLNNRTLGMFVLRFLSLAALTVAILANIGNARPVAAAVDEIADEADPAIAAVSSQTIR
tara:strand:+ start:343 stop:528 length:186 start_codon:yes stop_codon:yes gene_type:complete